MSSQTALQTSTDSRLTLATIMLYLIRFSNGWYKVGHTSTDIWKRACCFWTNSHPADLCRELGPEHIQIEALFAGGRDEEQTVFKAFPPHCGEFYKETPLDTVLEFMKSNFAVLPIPPKPEELEVTNERLHCCGGQIFECWKCPGRPKFNRSIKLKQHIDDVHRQLKEACPGCGLKVIQRNLKRHQTSCKSKR